MAEPYDTLLPILDAQLDRGGRASAYDEATRERAVDVALEAFEDEANQRFFPRTTTTQVIVQDGMLVLDDCDVTAVSAITDSDGNATDPATVTIADDELLCTGCWPPGIYTISYTHGLAACPPYVARAVALLASSMLADGPFDDRGYAVVDEGGFARLLTAGVAGASFSIPEVQAALQRCRNPWAGSR